MLTAERIKRALDECPCDGCGRLLRTGDKALVDLDDGAAYCSRACADEDARGRVAERTPRLRGGSYHA